MSILSEVTLSCESRIRDRDRKRSCNCANIVFLKPADLISDTGIPLHFAQIGNSHKTSPSSIARFTYVSAPSMTPLRQNLAHSSGVESTSRFDVHSQTFSDTTRERDRIRSDLNKTKTRLLNLAQNAAGIDIQQGLFIEQIESPQIELRAVEAKKDSAKTIDEQQACASCSDRKHRKDSPKVAEDRLCYPGIVTKVL